MSGLKAKLKNHIIPVFILSLVSLTATAAMADDADKKSDKPDENTVIVTAHKLDAAQESIQPSIGASAFSIPKGLVQALPGGENASLSKIMLQAPGVAQDSFGQVHIRGDHNGLQYRLNGVILPEGLSNFGEVLSARYAGDIQLLTGALPAQYGLRTAGVINITTKKQYDDGGNVSLYGGSFNTYQPSVSYGGSDGSNVYFGSLSYKTSDLGIESPYDTTHTLHDKTKQYLGFGYYEHDFNDANRVSLIAGVSDQKFQLPNTPGLNSIDDGAGYQVGPTTSFNSDNIDSNQHEATQFAVLSWLTSHDKFTGRVSLFARNSKLVYTPDWSPELAFNGVAQYARKTDFATGLQAEGAWFLNDKNTIRFGYIGQWDNSKSYTKTAVFFLDDDGAQTSTTPSMIVDASKKNANTQSLYVQNEWKPFSQLTVNYGVRYDNLDAYRKEHQLSPRANVVWTPTDGLTIHGGYSRYFTPPPFELIATQTQSLYAGSSFDISGPNDLPYAERDNYYDIGAQQKLGNFTFGIDYYARTARYMLDEGQFGAPIILTPFNYHYGRNKGVEFSVNYDKGPLSYYVNWAVAKAQGMELVSSQFNFGADDLAYIADHYIYVDHDQRTTASAGLTYKFGKNRIGLDTVYGTGLRKDGDVPNGDRMKAYNTYNVSFAHKFDIGKGLEARIDVVNLFDEKYELRDGSGIGVGAPQWGQRRGIYLGLSQNF